MRCILLRLLLVVVLLNTVVGVPLHAMAHVHAGGPTAQEAHDKPGEAAHEDEESVRESCAACIAFAQQSGAPPPGSGSLLVQRAAACAAPPRTASSLASLPGRWPASPRGPPI